MLDQVSKPRRRGFHQSSFGRFEHDRYDSIEAPELVAALDSVVGLKGRMIEPAAGRGYLAAELRRRGFEVVASDLIAHPNPLIPDIRVRDLRDIDNLEGSSWCITNLPYAPWSYHDELAEHLVRLASRDHCNVALLTRLAFTTGEGRQGLLHANPHFAGKIELFRPLWIEGKMKHAPIHNFAWCVWGAKPRPAGVRPWLDHRGADAPPSVRAARRGARQASANVASLVECDPKPVSDLEANEHAGEFATPDPKNEDGDLLAELREKSGALEDGDYAVEIDPPTTAPFVGKTTSGLVLGLRIVEGPQAGRLFSVRMMLQGSPRAAAFVERNVQILCAWADGVGAPPAHDSLGLAKALHAASQGFLVTATLATDIGRTGLPERSIRAIRCEV